jgi:ParB/RepB/Spo0J family partition protein
MKIPCSDILFDQSYNLSRDDFTAEDCDGLADTIKQDGLLQPITVIPIEHERYKYRLIVGFRRFCAVSQILGWEEIECTVREDTTEESVAIMNVVENIQRNDLSFYEAARALKEIFPTDTKMTDIVRRIGKTMNWVRPRWKLWSLPPEIIQQAKEGIISSSEVMLIVAKDAKDHKAFAGALIKAREEGLTIHEAARQSTGRKTVRRRQDIQKTMTHLFDNGFEREMQTLRYACGDITDVELCEILGCTPPQEERNILADDGFKTL